MAQGYGYGNARLRAMRSRLLTQGDYDELLDKANIGEVITRLAETPYRGHIETALVLHEGVQCVMEAVRAALIGALSKVSTFYEGEPAFLIGLLLRRWDRHNLLTILRAQKQVTPPENILAATVPVGRVDAVALAALARQAGLRAVVDLMLTWRLPYAHALSAAWARARGLPDLDQLELALNRDHYASLRQALEPENENHRLVLEQIATEIDIANISTLLRLVQIPALVPLVRQRYHASDVGPLLIEPGGYLPGARLTTLAGAVNDMGGIVRGLGDTRYAAALQNGWRRWQAGESDVTVLLRELERWQAEQSAALFGRDPLGIAIPIAYMAAVEIEAANLRIIAQGIARGALRAAVRRALIIV